MFRFRTWAIFHWQFAIGNCFFALLVLAAPAHARAQDTLPPVCSVPAAVSFFAPIVFPFKILQDEALMRDYVVSPEFAAARRARGDAGAVDVLFRRALERSWNNTGEACLICLLAVLDHRTLGIRFPLIGSLIWIPLTGEFEETYAARVAALPSRLYADSPPAVKLQSARTGPPKRKNTLRAAPRSITPRIRGSAAS